MPTTIKATKPKVTKVITVTKKVVPTVIKLTSTGLASAPGILKWAMNGWKFKADRVKMRNVMKSWPAEITDQQWDDILSGKIPHTIEGETVIIMIY